MDFATCRDHVCNWFIHVGLNLVSLTSVLRKHALPLCSQWRLHGSPDGNTEFLSGRKDLHANVSSRTLAKSAFGGGAADEFVAEDADEDDRADDGVFQ